MKIINQLQTAKLTGRGGAEFPVATKWLSVMENKVKNFKQPVYIVCNATEGEPGIEKDKYILRYHPKEVVGGIKIAMDTLGADKGYIFIKRKYLNSVKQRLSPFIRGAAIHFFPDDGGYLCGEETTLLQYMEGKRAEPRVKPPYPTESGFNGCPTLVNNVETFYYIYKISKKDYHDTRFYSIHGDVKNPGVFELPINWTIGEVLAKTKNAPGFEFFVQVGGGAAGDIFLSDEIDAPLKGAGSVIVYNLKRTNLRKLMNRWIDFFFQETCGKCAPCREGLYRLREELRSEEPNWLMLRAILETMRDSSFCPLGKSVYAPFFSLMAKIGVK